MPPNREPNFTHNPLNNFSELYRFILIYQSFFLQTLLLMIPYVSIRLFDKVGDPFIKLYKHSLRYYFTQVSYNKHIGLLGSTKLVVLHKWIIRLAVIILYRLSFRRLTNPYKNIFLLLSTQALKDNHPSVASNAGPAVNHGRPWRCLAICQCAVSPLPKSTLLNSLIFIPYNIDVTLIDR